jgi:hypothetical protein
VFFCYAFFGRVRDHRSDLASHRLAAGPLAAGWIIVTLVSNVIDRIGAQLELQAPVLLLGLLLGFVSVAFLVPVQDAINGINEAEVPDHDRNDRFTVWNWLWMLLGGIVTAAALLDTVIPTE